MSQLTKKSIKKLRQRIVEKKLLLDESLDSEIHFTSKESSIRQSKHLFVVDWHVVNDSD